MSEETPEHPVDFEQTHSFRDKPHSHSAPLDELHRFEHYEQHPQACCSYTNLSRNGLYQWAIFPQSLVE